MPKGPSLSSNEQVSLRSYDFSGGLNTRLVNTLLRDNELPLIENGFYDVLGAVKKRGGSSLFATLSVAASSTLTITALHRFYKSDGNKHFMWATHNGALGKLNDLGTVQTNLTTTLTASNFGVFNTALDKEIFTNGQNSPQKITDTAGTLSIAVLGGVPPVALHQAFHKGRLFLSGNPLAPSVLYFSESGDIETWLATSTILVGQNDGSKIMGIIKQFGLLIIFKETGIYTLSGDNPGNFSLQQQQDTAGVVAMNTIKTMNGIIFFLGRQGSRLGIFTYINGVITRVSQNIDASLQGVNLSYISNACAFVDFPYYYLQVPDGVSTVNNLMYVFDASINAWTTFTNLNANIITNWPGGSDSGPIYAGASTANGKIVQLFTGSQDQGSNFLMRFRTKYYDFGAQEFIKVNKVFYLTKESVWPATGVLKYDFDFANAGGTYPTTFALTTANWHLFPQSAQGQFCSFEFSDTSSNAVVVSGFSMLGEKFALRPT